MTSPTIFHFIRMSKFPLLNGVTVVILVTFGEMCLDFSVCNISKNYTWYIDTWTDIYKISQSGFFSSPVYHLIGALAHKKSVPLTLVSKGFEYFLLLAKAFEMT